MKPWQQPISGIVPNPAGSTLTDKKDKIRACFQTASFLFGKEAVFLFS